MVQVFRRAVVVEEEGEWRGGIGDQVSSTPRYRLLSTWTNVENLASVASF